MGSLATHLVVVCGIVPLGCGQAPTFRKKNLLCYGMLQGIGGGYPNFAKATKVANPGTKYKGMHLPTPLKDEHNRIISWVVVMCSPIAHCKQSNSLQTVKQSVVLLVVSLFLLGCVVPSLVGSTIAIRRQSEENHDVPKHITTKKNRKRKKSGWTKCPCPYQHCCRLSIPDAPFDHQSTGCRWTMTAQRWDDILVQYFPPKKSHPNFQCAAACML